VNLEAGKFLHDCLATIPLVKTDVYSLYLDSLRSPSEQPAVDAWRKCDLAPHFNRVCEQYKDILEILAFEKVKSFEKLCEHLVMYYTIPQLNQQVYEQACRDSQPLMEVGGTVLLTNDYLLTFRLDSVMYSKADKKYYIVEYKTGRSNKKWHEQWFSDLQINTYSYVGKCMFGSDFGGVLVVGFLFKGLVDDRPKLIKDCFRNIEQVKITVIKGNTALGIWYEQCAIKMAMIDQQLSVLKNFTSHKYLPVFPMNETLCHSFFGRECQFNSVCKTLCNPEKVQEPPLGFIESHWNPLKVSQTVGSIKKRLKDEEEGGDNEYIERVG